jgi:hypothetical protein
MLLTGKRINDTRLCNDYALGSEVKNGKEEKEVTGFDMGFFGCISYLYDSTRDKQH